MYTYEVYIHNTMLFISKTLKVLFQVMHTGVVPIVL